MRLAGPRLRALHAENSRTAQSIPEFREVGVQTRPIIGKAASGTVPRGGHQLTVLTQTIRPKIS